MLKVEILYPTGKFIDRIAALRNHIRDKFTLQTLAQYTE